MALRRLRQESRWKDCRERRPARFRGSSRSRGLLRPGGAARAWRRNRGRRAAPSAPHFIGGGQHMEQDQFGFKLAAIWQASAALGREVSLRVVACSTTRSSLPLMHREMSLGSHGDDREVDRAQHLFCHGAEQQLAEPAPAPGPEKNSIRLELPGGGRDLLDGVAFAHQAVAGRCCGDGATSHHGWSSFSAKSRAAEGS